MSLWTGAMGFRPSRGPMMIHALSACYASLRFHDLEFVTDSTGAKIADLLKLPYSRTTLLFNQNMSYRGGQEHIWALGKLAACLTQCSPFIHLDNDLLLVKDLPGRITSAEMVAQSMDDEKWYTGDTMRRAFAIAGIPTNCTKYNAGILGGNDVASIRKWAYHAMTLAGGFSGMEDELGGTVCSMVSEQASLGHFSTTHGIPVTTMMKENFDSDEEMEKGYFHYIHRKNESHWLEATEKRFEEEFPEEYSSFNRGWERISRKLAVKPLPAVGRD